eukprot:c21366_g1_i2.p1 GENE.c21366_g1_i2~~c21366_g1_i2.p1  ORF type:complete len:471 (+),score=182.39 c21366_g1_i2:114-1526(+)
MERDLQRLSLSFTESESIVKVLDQDENGSIDLLEYATAWNFGLFPRWKHSGEMEVTKSKISLFIQKFREFDKNNDEELSVAELIDMIQSSKTYSKNEKDLLQATFTSKSSPTTIPLELYLEYCYTEIVTFDEQNQIKESETLKKIRSFLVDVDPEAKKSFSQEQLRIHFRKFSISSDILEVFVQTALPNEVIIQNDNINENELANETPKNKEGNEITLSLEKFTYYTLAGVFPFYGLEKPSSSFSKQYHNFERCYFSRNKYGSRYSSGQTPHFVSCDTPTIETNLPKSVEVCEGSELDISWDVKGANRFSWTKDETKIEDADQSLTERYKRVKVTIEDSGRYQCTASNRAGDVVSDVCEVKVKKCAEQKDKPEMENGCAASLFEDFLEEENTIEYFKNNHIKAPPPKDWEKIAKNLKVGEAVFLECEEKFYKESSMAIVCQLNNGMFLLEAVGKCSSTKPSKKLIPPIKN